MSDDTGARAVIPGELAPNAWRPTLEIELGHGRVLSDGERLQIELREAPFRYEALRTLAEDEILLYQLDVLSMSAREARWLDLDAACKAWTRGWLGAGKLGLSAAEEEARRAAKRGVPVQSRVPDAFVFTHRVELLGEAGRRVAEVFSDGSRGFWRALEPSPELVRDLIERFARPQHSLGPGASLDDGLQADGLTEWPPWRLSTLEHVLGYKLPAVGPRQRLAREPGSVRSEVVEPVPPPGEGAESEMTGAPPAAWLVYRDATGAHRVPLRPPGVVVGRDAGLCDVVVKDFGLSREHARIAVDSRGRLTLSDLKSKSGSHVNGRPVAEATIAPDDELVLGGVSFRVVATPPEASAGDGGEPGRQQRALDEAGDDGEH